MSSIKAELPAAALLFEPAALSSILFLPRLVVDRRFFSIRFFRNQFEKENKAYVLFLF